jgi:uncharacterized protein YodC (DUF2158 family)
MGGPAFPGEYIKHKSGEVGNSIPITEYSSGMTLRDWFAGMALQGMLSWSCKGSPDEFAALAYENADAMLAARGTHE